MKKLLLIALTGLLTIGATAPALALGPLDVDAELPLYSKYVWRGMTNTDDYVLQPSLKIGVFGFELGVWSNMDLTDINDDEGEFKEIDYTLGYKLGLAIVELGAGFIHYQYPEIERDDTTEFYLSGKVNVILSPSLAIYQDIDKYKGAYWAASVGHGFEMGESAKIDLTAGLGLGSKSFIEGYYPVNPGLPWNPDFSTGSSPTDYYIDARLPFHPIPFLTIAPSVTWTSLLGDAKDSGAAVPEGAVYAGNTDAFYWGLSAKFSF